jgi:hypothetical protein
MTGQEMVKELAGAFFVVVGLYILTVFIFTL